MSFLSRLVNPFKHSVTRALLNKSPTLNALRGGRHGRNPLIKPSAKPVERPMMAKPAFDPTMAKPINRPPMMAKPIRDPSMPGNPVSPTEDVAVSTWQKPRNATLPGTVDGPTYAPEFQGGGIAQPGQQRDFAQATRGGTNQGGSQSPDAMADVASLQQNMMSQIQAPAGYYEQGQQQQQRSWNALPAEERARYDQATQAQMGVTRDYVLDGQRPQQGARVPGGGLQRLRPRMAAALEETGGEDLYGARRRNPLMYR